MYLWQSYHNFSLCPFWRMIESERKKKRLEPIVQGIHRSGVIDRIVRWKPTCCWWHSKIGMTFNMTKMPDYYTQTEAFMPIALVFIPIKLLWRKNQQQINALQVKRLLLLIHETVSNSIHHYVTCYMTVNQFNGSLAFGLNFRVDICHHHFQMLICCMNLFNLYHNRINSQLLQLFRWF